MNSTVKTILIWVLILFVAVGVYNFFERHTTASEISYTEFLNAVDKGEVIAVTITGSTVVGRSLAANPVFEVAIPEDQAALYEKLIAKKVQVTVNSIDHNSSLALFAAFVSWVFSMLAAFGLGWLCARWSGRPHSPLTMAI